MNTSDEAKSFSRVKELFFEFLIRDHFLKFLCLGLIDDEIDFRVDRRRVGYVAQAKT